MDCNLSFWDGHLCFRFTKPAHTARVEESKSIQRGTWLTVREWINFQKGKELLQWRTSPWLEEHWPQSCLLKPCPCPACPKARDLSRPERAAQDMPFASSSLPGQPAVSPLQTQCPVTKLPQASSVQDSWKKGSRHPGYAITLFSQLCCPHKEYTPGPLFSPFHLLWQHSPLTAHSTVHMTLQQNLPVTRTHFRCQL